MQRREAAGVKAPPGKVAQGDGMVERPGRRGSCLGHGTAPDPRQNADRVSVGGLALARPHAVGGVALHQLGAVEALLRRVDEVLVLDVLVQIHEALLGRVWEDGVGMARRSWCRALTPALDQIAATVGRSKRRTYM